MSYNLTGANPNVVVQPTLNHPSQPIEKDLHELACCCELPASRPIGSPKAIHLHEKYHSVCQCVGCGLHIACVHFVFGTWLQVVALREKWQPPEKWHSMRLLLSLKTLYKKMQGRDTFP